MESILTQVKRGGSVFSRIALIGSTNSAMKSYHYLTDLKNENANNPFIKIYTHIPFYTKNRNPLNYSVFKEEHSGATNIGLNLKSSTWMMPLEVIQIEPENNVMYDSKNMGLSRYEVLGLSDNLESTTHLQKLMSYSLYNKIQKKELENTFILTDTYDFFETTDLRKYFMKLFNNLDHEKQPQSIDFLFVNGDNYDKSRELNILESAITFEIELNRRFTNSPHQFNIKYINISEDLWNPHLSAHVLDHLASLKSDRVNFEIILGKDIQTVKETEIILTDGQTYPFNALVLNARK